MKTSKTFNPRMKNIIIGLSLSCSLAIVMGSCQKEESAQPASGNSDYNDQKQINIPGGTFEFLIIDHYSGNSLLPEYSIKVKSNGIAVFEGKKNVAFIGKVQFEIPASTIISLKELFSHSNFMNMRDEVIYCPDLPINATTYAIKTGDDFIKTLHDRDSKPAELVSLRNKAEELLHISKYILTGPRFIGAAAIAVD